MECEERFSICGCRVNHDEEKKDAATACLTKNSLLLHSDILLLCKNFFAKCSSCDENAKIQSFFIIYIMTHPLSDFKYCPHCGSDHFADHDLYSRRCADCGFTFYANAAAATVAVILNERNELLCVRRKNEPEE